MNIENKLKKIVLLLITLSLYTIPVYGADFAVKLNGKSLMVNTINNNGIIFVPFKDIFENFGFDVKCANRQLSAENEEFILKLQSDYSKIDIKYKNMKRDELVYDSEVKSIDNKIYVPVREVSEVLGFKVEWDSKRQTVDIYEQTEMPKIGKGETKIILDNPIAYSFDDDDLRYIERFIVDNIDRNFTLDRFKIMEKSLTNINEVTVFGVLSLKYIKDGFVTDYGYDFYIQNGLANMLVVTGNPKCEEKTDIPNAQLYTDEELMEMALQDIKLYKNERITEQRVLRKYKSGKYICGVVTEITNVNSDISRAEYFEVAL